MAKNCFKLFTVRLTATIFFNKSGIANYCHSWQGEENKTGFNSAEWYKSGAIHDKKVPVGGVALDSSLWWCNYQQKARIACDEKDYKPREDEIQRLAAILSNVEHQVNDYTKNSRHKSRPKLIEIIQMTC